MGKFSLEKLFGMTIRESATDGSDFTNPDADYRRLFLGEDGGLHLKDSAGTVTDVTPAAGAVGTDAIWDAAGDLAVGSGANTAARLALGAAGGYVSRINGAVAWNSGTGFPTAATGDRYWRTDLGMEFYYDGTRWLTTQVFTASPVVNTAFVPLTASGAAAYRTAFPDKWGGSDIWFERYFIGFNVAGGTALDGSNKWAGSVVTYGAVTTLVTATIDSGASDAWRHTAGDINALGGTEEMLAMSWVKTGTPGDLYSYASVYYRIVAT